jgi:phosphoenolpyruvate phosphomutase
MVPDEDLVSTEKICNLVSSIRRISAFPIFVDGGQGGSSIQAARRLHDLFAAGANAVTLEDSAFPKVNSLIDVEKRLASIESFCQKIQGVSMLPNAKSNYIIARCEGLLVGDSVASTLVRAEAYIAAGARAIFLHGKHAHLDMIKEFAITWNNKSPLVLCPTMYPDFSLTDAKKYKVSGVIYANHGMRAVIRTLRSLYSQLISQQSASSIESQIATFNDLYEISVKHSNLGGCEMNT